MLHEGIEMKLRSMMLAGLSLALIALPGGAAIAGSNDGMNRSMRIDNQTDNTVLEMHVSNVGSGRWGPDQLGSDGTISPHHYMNWNIDDGSGYCRFDFKFVMDEGPDLFAYNVNVCSESELDVTD